MYSSKFKFSLLATLVALFLSFSALAQENKVTTSEEQKHVCKHEGQKQACKQRGCNPDETLCCIHIPNLTDEQKKKIKDLDISLAKEIMPLKYQLGEKQAHLKTLMAAEKADITAINKTIDEMVQLGSTTMKKRAANYQSIRALLTDEQKIELDSKFHFSSLCWGMGDGCCGIGKGCGMGHHAPHSKPDGCKH